jgi:TonB family protein
MKKQETMINLVNFIIESGVSLTLLASVYVLFLRKETFFMANRLFLLGSLVFSVLLPLLRLRVLTPQPVLLSEVTVTPYRNLLESITVYGHGFTGQIEKTVLSAQLLVVIYLAGVGLLLSLFIFRIIQILLKIRKSEVENGDGFRLVLLEKETTPFSFLNYIFVNRSQMNDAGYNRMMIHELEHVKQGHSFDVIILELLSAFQWFNPFMWLLRRAIRENHEFLADRAVLNTGTSRGEYKQLLLNQFIGEQLVVANNFNYSLIKNRIKMMSKINSPKIALSKTIIGVLAAVALIIAFACEQKESVVNEADSGDKSVRLSIQDGKMKIDGSAEDVEKLRAMFDGKTYFTMITDTAGNNILAKTEFPVEKQADASEEVFFIVEEMPEFPGGEQALREFIAKNVEYPKIAQEKGIQGKVYVTFVVGTDGNVKDAKIARGVDPSLDAEALRVVGKMNGWKPGKQRGQVVNVSYTVPINFKLQ